MVMQLAKHAFRQPILGAASSSYFFSIWFKSHSRQSMFSSNWFQSIHPHKLSYFYSTQTRPRKQAFKQPSRSSQHELFLFSSIQHCKLQSTGSVGTFLDQQSQDKQVGRDCSEPIKRSWRKPFLTNLGLAEDKQTNLGLAALKKQFLNTWPYLCMLWNLQPSKTFSNSQSWTQLVEHAFRQPISTVADQTAAFLLFYSTLWATAKPH